MRALRIEARRSVAPWAGLLFALLALGFLFLMSGPWWKAPADWTTQLTTTALWVRFLLVFLWPVVVGAGAIQGMRDTRSGMHELLATTPRPHWHRGAVLAAALGALTVLGFLLVFVVGAIEVLANGGFVSAGFVPVVAVGALVVIAGAWLGLAVGRLLPHPLTAPALAVVSLVLTVLLWSALDPETFTSSVLGSVRAGLLGPAIQQPHGSLVTTATSVDAGQAVWFAGLAVTCFFLLAAKTVRARLLGLLPAAVAVAIALAVFPATAEETMVPDSSAAAQVCDGPVCVSKMHEAVLPTLATAGREALEQLGNLPGAPTRVAELTDAVANNQVPPRDPAVVYVDFQSTPALLYVSADQLRTFLLAGAGTPSCLPRSWGDAGDIAARTVSASWFGGELKPLPAGTGMGPQANGPVEQAWAAFRTLPRAEQESRIVALRQFYLTCPENGNALDVLVPGMAP
ncbi:hypothetical protein FPZ12_027720 [Amycolatopsis acidicola]|uniref:Uncharacterized protein n=1 Tax=Amycolatopsis acidicola TaxID=2596893 RepID=A0A5N0UV61_9PSEU|nr:hypothetical protein [Amycolatopsis acidicola]KAA9156311.1 hypothetical protein FPZ12_027720 [Amycolatopsis acidicola]